MPAQQRNVSIFYSLFPKRRRIVSRLNKNVWLEKCKLGLEKGFTYKYINKMLIITGFYQYGWSSLIHSNICWVHMTCQIYA